MQSGRILAPLILVVVAAACSGGDAGRKPPAGAQRTMLSEGYSLLYADASHLRLMRLVLYVKLETHEFEDVIVEISEFGGELKLDLERIDRDYPGVRIDLEPLPEMETRKRFAIARDRMIRFAPLSGHSRREYERTLLIGMANALNHESHLCRVMAEEEPDPGLRKFLLKTERRYGALHDRTMALLDRVYFKADAPASAQR